MSSIWIDITKFEVFLLLRIPKHWSWSGALHSKPDEPALCTVNLRDPTREQQGLRFSVAFQATKKIEMTHLYDNADISAMIPAFRPPSQLALLSAGEGTLMASEKDVESFNTVIAYLQKTQKVCIKPYLVCCSDARP